jgi:hypothetical protein
MRCSVDAKLGLPFEDAIDALLEMLPVTEKNLTEE